MEQFIECKLVGEVRTSICDHGKEYHLPNYKKFFGVYSNPDTIRLNTRYIISANIASKLVAHLVKKPKKRNIFQRILFFRPKMVDTLVEDGYYSTCRLVIQVANKSEIIFVQTEVYDALYPNNKN